MAIIVQGTDGEEFEFPDNTSDDVMTGALRAHYAAKANPTGDVAQSFASNVVQGVAGTPGLPGDIQAAANAAGTALSERGLNPLDPLRAAADVAARQTVGRVYNRFAPGGTGTWEADTRPPVPDVQPPQLPGSQDFQKAFNERVLQPYVPATKAGQVAATAGQMVGGGLLLPGGSIPQKVAAGITGGLGAEGAGAVAEGLGHPDLAPYARAAGAIAAPIAAGRIAAPFRTSPERMAAAETLRAEGVPVSAGQQTGSKLLQYTESALGESPLGVRPAANQQERFNAAVGRRMMAPGQEAPEALTGPVMRGRSAEISQGYNEVLARNPLDVDLPLTQDLVRVAERYGDRVALAQRPQFARDMDLLRTEIQRQGGQLSGDQYQQLRSTFAQRARDFQNTDGAYANANREVKRALDAAWERSATAAGNTEDVAIKRGLDSNTRAMKTIENALAAAPDRTLGNVSPFAIDSAARASAGTAATVRGTDDLANLAGAGRTIMRQAPNSGTVNRAQVLNLPSALGFGAGAYTMNPFIGLGGWLAPGLASQVVNRALGQRYLSGRLPGQGLFSRGVLSGAQALVNAQKGILGGR
jgi:hypothetical protein